MNKDLIKELKDYGIYKFINDNVYDNDVADILKEYVLEVNHYVLESGYIKINNSLYNRLDELAKAEENTADIDIKIYKRKEPKQMILLKNSNNDEVDYVFNIAPGDLDKALEYRDLKRAKGECDSLSDFELIIDYLKDNDIDFDVNDFQDYEVKYY